MHKHHFTAAFLALATLTLGAQTRQWTVSDGLPANEVRQLVELPDGQMLVGCEGLYCLSVGEAFVPVDYDRQQAVALPRFAARYGHMWQGDSLLWLHDLYRLYLFDARTRRFRSDASRLADAPDVRAFAASEAGLAPVDDALWPAIDSLALGRKCTAAIRDRQGGLWIGTREDGIVYRSPRVNVPLTLRNDSLLWLARGALGSRRPLPKLPFRRVGFTCDLPDGRTLIGHDMNRLSYYMPGTDSIRPIALARLSDFRNIVGACPVDSVRVLLYAQNGVTLLHTGADTLADFAPARDIAPYTDKYNCVLPDREGNLWIGTQNGLFVITPARVCKRIGGLANHCIRSLVLDASRHVWAGTSCGLSRITPSVVNYGAEDGIPLVSMMERAACLTRDSLLVFVHGSHCTVFRPEWLTGSWPALPVRLLSVSAGGTDRSLTEGSELTLRHDENHIALLVSTLDYAHTAPSRYRCRLLPLETDWNEVTPQRGAATIAYTALPHGTYTCEVQAATPDGDWTDSTRLTWVIRPPLWLTWWAKSLYVAAALALVTAGVALYVKRKRRQLQREDDERVNRLFELRAEARHQFAVHTHVDPQKVGLTADEEALMARLLQVVGEHLDDSEYGVDQMAQDVAISRSRLYDRLRDILGISPADFIRDVRLKHSALLLADTTLPIGDIAAQVGFATARNFSQQFKRMYGMLPTEYRAQGIGRSEK